MQYNVCTGKCVKPPKVFISKNSSINIISNKRTNLPPLMIYFDVETDSLFADVDEETIQIPNVIEYTLVVVNLLKCIKHCTLYNIDDYILPYSNDTLEVTRFTHNHLKKPIEQMFDDIDYLCDKYGIDNIGIMAHNGINFDFLIMNYLSKYTNALIPENIKKLKMFDSLRIARDLLPHNKHTNSYLYKHYFLNAVKPLVPKETFDKFNNLLLHTHESLADVKMMIYWSLYMFQLSNKVPEVNYVYIEDLQIKRKNKLVAIFNEDDFFDTN